MKKSILGRQIAPYRFIHINHAVVSGYLTHDTDLKYSKTGTPICAFQIGVTDRHKGKLAATSHFFQIVAFGDAAINAAKLRKGLPILVEGSLYGKNTRAKILADHIWRMTDDESGEAIEAPEDARPPKAKCQTRRVRPEIPAEDGTSESV